MQRYRSLLGWSIIVRRTSNASNAAAKEVVTTTSSSVSTEPVRVANEHTVYRPPFYRKPHRHHTPKHMLQEEFPNAGDVSGAGARLYDYYKTVRMVNSLHSVKEKIDFVSPYERPWTAAEKKWRRDWHPSLMATRKAWSIPHVPAYFDCLDYYKYITKTRLEEKNLDMWYETLNPPTKTFENLFSETLLHLIDSTRFESNDDRTRAILSFVIDEAIQVLVDKVKKLEDYRIAYDARSESFWVRSGFMFVYDVKEIESEEVERRLRNAPKFIGDDRRKLGELAFVSRDLLAAQIRSRYPLNPLFSLDNPRTCVPIFDESVNVAEDVLFSPKVFNMWPDEEPLWQCPGYFPEMKEREPFGRLGLKSVADVNERCENWGMKGKEFDDTFTDCVKSQAVASLFTTLCAQAHAQGFTQYTDVTRPFVSQLILSDGKNFAFAIGQLNTLAINFECDGYVNNRTNFVQFEGPFTLYDTLKDGEFFYHEGDQLKKGLNPKVLLRIMQMILKD